MNRTLLRLLMVAFVGAAPVLRAQAPTEYQLKAIFLLKIAQFVQWPPATFANAESPVVIGVLGDDPFGSELTAVVANETVDGRPLVIQHYRQVDEIKMCHVLFVSQSESQDLEKVFAALKDRSILTVGESETFARRGGMVQFRFENNRVRLMVAPGAATAAKLTISSKLLRSVEVIGPLAAGT